jgi:hypothetical protein
MPLPKKLRRTGGWGAASKGEGGVGWVGSLPYKLISLQISIYFGSLDPSTLDRAE